MKPGRELFPIRLIKILLYMLSCSVLTLPPHGMVPPDPGPRHNVPPLGYSRLLTFHICLLFPHLYSQIPCKYHAIQHHLQRLRLHQPAFTPIRTHHRSTGGAECKGANHDHAKGGGRGRSDTGAYIIIVTRRRRRRIRIMELLLMMLLKDAIVCCTCRVA